MNISNKTDPYRFFSLETFLIWRLVWCTASFYQVLQRYNESGNKQCHSEQVDFFHECDHTDINKCVNLEQVVYSEHASNSRTVLSLVVSRRFHTTTLFIKHARNASDSWYAFANWHSANIESIQNNGNGHHNENCIECICHLWMTSTTIIIKSALNVMDKRKNIGPKQMDQLEVNVITLGGIEPPSTGLQPIILTSLNYRVLG